MSELIDNRTRRVAIPQEIIQRLHKGEAPEAVKGQLREIVRQTYPSEIMATEEELLSGGMPVEKVRSMCDLHSHVTREVLGRTPGEPDCSRPSYRNVSTAEQGHRAGGHENTDNSRRDFCTGRRSGMQGPTAAIAAKRERVVGHRHAAKLIASVRSQLT